MPDYNIKYKNGNNIEDSLTQTDRNNNHNDASQDSIKAQKLINEDSSHLNPFQKNIENENDKKSENKKFKSQEIIQMINIKKKHR